MGGDVRVDKSAALAHMNILWATHPGHIVIHQRDRHTKLTCVVGDIYANAFTCLSGNAAFRAHKSDELTSKIDLTFLQDAVTRIFLFVALFLQLPRFLRHSSQYTHIISRFERILHTKAVQQ